jgi:flavin-dependent dehydrogenase/geranylgeranyl pyrophosphate synthase
MNQLTESEVLVIGAGPAGAVAALALARQGVQVLLVDDEAGAAPCGHYDLLVSGPAAHELETLGVPRPERALEVPALVLRSGTASREIADAGAYACDAEVLREHLRAVAAGAGVVVRRGPVITVSTESGRALAVTPAGTVAADHVVVATGPGGRSAWAGAAPADGVICAGRFTGAGLAGRAVLLMTAPAATRQDDSPACVWAVPGEAGAITVGMARADNRDKADPADLLDLAVGCLAEADPGFRALHRLGPLVSGPLGASFTPAHIARSEHLLIGGAAGLANAFSGESVSYAVQSGLLAAQAIAAHRSSPAAARRMYARLAAGRFVGHLEAAHHAARRYHLAWRLLATAIGSDHPFYAKLRRAVILPAGVAGLTGDDPVPVGLRDRAVTGPFLVACDEITLGTVRDAWPFLARIMATEGDLARHRLRPALLFLGGVLAEGNKPGTDLAALGAAIELATLGALAFFTPPANHGPAQRGQPPDVRGMDWAAVSTVLAGDFLLSQAYRLTAEYVPEVSGSFADWLAELATLRAIGLDSVPGAAAAAVFGALFEFPARIGAHLGGGSPATAAAMRTFGRECGHAFLHAEDILALRQQRTRLDTTLRAMFLSQMSALPAACGDDLAASAGRLLADPVAVATAQAAAADACRGAARRALDVLPELPDPMARRVLRDYAVVISVPSATIGQVPWLT